MKTIALALTYGVCLCPSIVPTASLFAGETPVASLQDALEVPDQSMRAKACDSIIAVYKASTDEEKAAITAKYEEVILAILHSPVQPQEHWLAPTSTRNLAVRLAGNLRVISAVPRLTELLRLLQGEVVKSYKSGFFYQALEGSTEASPAADALMQIGEPARSFLKTAQAESNNLAIDRTLEKGSEEHRNRLMKLKSINRILQSMDD